MLHPDFPFSSQTDLSGIAFAAMRQMMLAQAIGQATAFSMLIEMHELGTMTGKQAASLAGLAPISRQSGKWQSKERIQGGTAFFRRAMYMPALCIIRHNLSSKQKYDQMIKTGKPAKVAITAIMRKLVVLANVLLRDDWMWAEKPT